MGKFVRLIPHLVMMGFVNGLAIVIFWTQKDFFMKKIGGEKVLLEGNELYIRFGLVTLTMGIIFGLPKLTKKVPAALVAIVVVASIPIFGGLEVSTVKSFVIEGSNGKSTGIEGSLPTFQNQIFTLFYTLKQDWLLILSTAFLLAAVGLIESLIVLFRKSNFAYYV